MPSQEGLLNKSGVAEEGVPFVGEETQVDKTKGCFYKGSITKKTREPGSCQLQSHTLQEM